MYLKSSHAIVCLSGGLGSFLSAYLYQQKYPNKTLLGYFNDVKNEDLDTYRFLVEGAEYLGIELIRDCDGRDIWQVFEDERYIGNTRTPNCSTVLKIKQRVDWLASNCEQGIDLIIGFDWTEIHRVDRAIENEKFATIIAPLVEDLRNKTEIYELLENPPRLPELYDYGFSHANCGGCCVQAGQGQWASVLKHFPERYKYHELRMEDIMSRNSKLKPFLRVTLNGELSYLTLKQFRERLEAKPMQLALDFSGGCGCAFA
jgi:hypothetical protein